MHVPLRRHQILMAGELLDRSCRGAAHREVRTERVPQSMYAALAELRASHRSSNVILDDLLRERRAVALTEHSRAA